MKTVDANKISKQIIEIFSNEGITINMARDILTQVGNNLDNQRVNSKPSISPRRIGEPLLSPREISIILNVDSLVNMEEIIEGVYKASSNLLK